MVTEFVGSCIKFEPDSMADFIYSQISDDKSNNDFENLASGKIIHKFKSIVSQVNQKCRSSKLIEDTSQINNKEVLVEDVEKEELEKAIKSVDKDTNVYDLFTPQQFI